MAQVRADYNLVQSCQADADCNYVDGFYADGSYTVLASTGFESIPVAVTDCFEGPGQNFFLVTANPTLVRQHAGQIAADIEEEMRICSEENPTTIRCQSFVTRTFTVPPKCGAEGRCVFAP